MVSNRKQLIVLRSYSLLSAAASMLCALLLWRAVSLHGDGSLSGISNAWFGFLAIIMAAGVFSFILAVKVFNRSSQDSLLAFMTDHPGQGLNLSLLYFIGIYLYILGSIYLFSASPVIFGPTFPIWLVPFFFWLVSMSLLTLVHLALFRERQGYRNTVQLALLLLIVTAGILVNLQFWAYDSPHQEDIYFIYLDGGRLLDGVNPYERVLTGDMRVNDKYSTYFPVFYYLSWATQRLGLDVFSDWLSFWRVVFLIANLSIALLLFYIPIQGRLLALSVFAALFWLFNRWTLHVSKTADIDFLPLLLLLLSLYLYQRHARASYLALGLSLAIKQMGIFLIPLYLIWVWLDGSRIERLKNLAIAVVFIGIVPFVTSLPFLAWNWEGFYRSILFSATRDPAAAFEVYSLDAVLGLSGIPAKAPLLIMLAAVYWLVWKHKIHRYTPALLVLAVFVFFNSVMYTSYMVWVVALIPLAAYETAIVLSGDASREAQHI